MKYKVSQDSTSNQNDETIMKKVFYAIWYGNYLQNLKSLQRFDLF